MSTITPERGKVYAILTDAVGDPQDGIRHVVATGTVIAWEHIGDRAVPIVNRHRICRREAICDPAATRWDLGGVAGTTKEIWIYRGPFGHIAAAGVSLEAALGASFVPNA